MDKSRIAIIVLILIAILFAIGIGVGMSRNDGEDNITADSSKEEIERALKKVPDFFSSLSQDKKLAAKDFASPPVSGASITMEFSKDDRVVAQIKESDAEPRNAVFKLVSGAQARIQYFPAAIPDEIKDKRTREKLRGENLIDLNLLVRTSNTGRCNRDDESCKQLTIFKKGGRLEFTCSGDAPCRVELQK